LFFSRLDIFPFSVFKMTDSANVPATEEDSGLNSTTMVVCQPPIQEKKQDPNAIEFICSPEEISKTLVVFGPKHQLSKNQKRRIFVLTSAEQNPHPDPEELKSLNHLDKLLKPGIQYPKMKVVLPPMKLLTKSFKLAGPGQNPAAGKKDNDGGGGMESWTHSFWLLATTEGMNERALAAEGGAEELKKRQLEAYNLMRIASIELERKRFFHPDSLAELESLKEAQMMTYQSMRPDITWQEVCTVMFRSSIANHEHLKIIANLPKMSGQTSTGISLTSKAWYQPKEKPTVEDNEEAVKEYIQVAQESEPKFKVNEQIIAGIMKGLRHRRVPVYGKVGGKLVLQDPPADPMKFQCRAGDFVRATATLNMYDSGSKGQTWSVEKFQVVSQANNEQNKELELDDKYAACDDFQVRYVPKRIKQEVKVPVLVKTESDLFVPPVPLPPVVQAPILPREEITSPQPLKKFKKEHHSYMQPPPDEDQQRLEDEYA
jgi:hypothetical protein